MPYNVDEYREGYEDGVAAGPVSQLGDAFFSILDSREYIDGYRDARQGLDFDPGRHQDEYIEDNKSAQSGWDDSSESSYRYEPSNSYGTSDSPPPQHDPQRAAIAAMIVGVISLFICPCLGPVAMIMGVYADRDLRSSELHGSRGYAIAAIVIGLISVGELVIMMMWMLVAGSFPLLKR